MSLMQRWQIEEMNKRYAIRTKEDDWFSSMMARIACGENYYDLAHEHGWKGHLFRHWIAAWPEREAKLQAALKHRAEADAEMRRPRKPAAKPDKAPCDEPQIL